MYICLSGIIVGCDFSFINYALCQAFPISVATWFPYHVGIYIYIHTHIFFGEYIETSEERERCTFRQKGQVKRQLREKIINLVNGFWSQACDNIIF